MGNLSSFGEIQTKFAKVFEQDKNDTLIQRFVFWGFVLVPVALCVLVIASSHERALLQIAFYSYQSRFA